MANQAPTRQIEREKVYDVLDGEREYQQKTHPDSPVPSLVDFTNLLIEYTDKLAVDVTVDPNGSSPAGGPLKRLREIAAIAVHAMEAHGAQPRENHVPASAGITGVVKIVGKQDSTKPARSTAPVTHPATVTAAPAQHHAAEPVAEHTTQHPGAEHHK